MENFPWNSMYFTWALSECQYELRTVTFPELSTYFAFLLSSQPCTNECPIQYANGRLLGYNVYYRSRQYYYYSDIIVRVNSTNLPQAILLNVQVGERYQISVAAFTSVGTGPRSPLLYVTKGKVCNQGTGLQGYTENPTQ